MSRAVNRGDAAEPLTDSDSAAKSPLAAASSSSSSSAPPLSASASPLSVPSQPSLSARQQQLLALRLKMNAGRRENARSAKEEMDRLAGKAEPKQHSQHRHNPRQQQHGEQPHERSEQSSGRATSSLDPAIVPLLHEAADAADGRWREQKGKQRRKQGYASDELDEEEERKEGATDEQGRRRVQEMSSHNVFDPQTAHRQYERNLLHAQQQQRVHSHSEQSTASSSSSAADPYTARSAPSETAVDRLVADIDAATKRRAAFSRRRRFNEQEDVTYINERNRTFNKKVARAFDAFTIDIAQSLERGTAL